jgi:hypothetical protein
VALAPCEVDGCLADYWTVSWKLMEWEVLPESAAVTAMIWTPEGVPGVVAGGFGEEELQPESEMRPDASRNVSRLTRVRQQLSLRMQRGERIRNTRPAQAMPGREPEISLRSEALVVAVVVIVRVVVEDAPQAGVREAGTNVQEVPVGRAPQENWIVPL